MRLYLHIGMQAASSQLFKVFPKLNGPVRRCYHLAILMACAMRTRITLIVLCILAQTTLQAQQPQRFDSEIRKINKLSLADGDQRVVFTGSSSIRKWETLSRDCQGKKVVNTGFGGSHASDLFFWLKETVLRFNPDAVYIYEGDNDIAEGKRPKAILNTMRNVASRILASDKEVKVYFLSAKPSPSRWEFKEEYLAFNALLEAYCQSHPRLNYIDVWTPMLDQRGRPAAHIFVADSLHMNEKGYEIWREVVCNSSGSRQ